MSHQIEHRDYPKNVNKKKVERALNDYVSQATWQEGGGGLGQPIRWIDSTVYDSYEEAERAIEKLDKGWYDQLAVLYIHRETPRDKRLEEMQKEKRKHYTDYVNRDKVVYANGLKAKLVTCKCCESKLAREYLSTNLCPVCRKDMRPDYMLKSIASAKRRVERDAEKIAEYIKKKGKKEVRWLVKIEYHL